MKKALLALLLAAAVGPASALDLSWSGYATLGWARSNVDGRYLRWIDRDGSFNAESALAGQLDARFSPRWSATVQLKATPAEDSDSRWALKPAWVFVAWRPTDEWLLRGGRMRVPLYLHSESLDIGASHDMARLPVEMYSIAPSNDFTGGFATYTRGVEGPAQGELSLEAFGGRIEPKARVWLADAVPGVINAGAQFREADARIGGVVATLRSPSTTLRAMVLTSRAQTTADQGVPVRFPLVQPGPGIAYYRVDESLPGPPIERAPRLKNMLISLGAEQQLGGGLRLVAEYGRTRQFGTDLGSNSSGGYIAAFADAGRFTPYVSFGRLSTGAVQMEAYRQLAAVRLPPGVPGGAQIEASQRLGTLYIYAANQDTFALGSAWRTPWGGKLKLEWANTRVYEVSRLVDAPAGAPPIRDQRFDTWTVNYSLAF
jgi:hypothetical protein